MTTTTLTPEWVNRLQDKANRALLDHDWTTLESLVAPGARIVGPRGFLISRDRWIGVHQESAYEQERIEVVESVVDTYDNCAVRIDLVESRCRYEGKTIAGRFRGLPDVGDGRGHAANSRPFSTRAWTAGKPVSGSSVRRYFDRFRSPKEHQPCHST